MQRRGVVHFHAVIRLDGADPDDPSAPAVPAGAPSPTWSTPSPPPPHGVMFVTDPHRSGWVIGWGTQLDVRPINGTDGAITDGMVAGYLAKYATKATEATGHLSRRLTRDTIDVYADPDGTHTERLVEACWRLGRAKDWHGLRRWAHMLGFGGHFLTKSRYYSVTFRVLREARAVWQRTPRRPGATEPTRRPHARRQLPRVRRRRLAHHRRRPARQHRRRKRPRARHSTGGLSTTTDR